MGNALRFSHRYVKMTEIESKDAILLEVLRGKFEYLSQAFVDFDTLFINEETGQPDHYRFPAEGDCIILIYLDPQTKRLFTTVRPYDYGKAGYYSRHRGEAFEIVISNGGAEKITEQKSEPSAPEEPKKGQLKLEDSNGYSHEQNP